MSVRLSTAWPRACSGLMYAAVPRMTPSRVPPTVMVGDCVRSASRHRRRHAFASRSRDLHDAVRRDLDIRRLQIAMDDAFLVRGLERVRDLPRDRAAPPSMRQLRRGAMRSASVSPSTSSRTSARHAVALFQAVDRADVRMIERREHARLALEAREAIGIGS